MITGKIDGSISKIEIRESLKGIKEDVILCCHTHRSYIGQLDKKRILNAGGVGISFDGDNRESYGILDFSEEGLKIINRRVEYSIDKLFEVAEKRNFPQLDSYKKTIRAAKRL